MARSLYSKFILGYLIFGLLSVLTIASFSSGMTRDYLIKDRANALYDEANDIAASCSLMYQGQHQDMDLFSTQLKNVSTYLHTETWVVNKSGVVIMDSKNGNRIHTTIPDFDPTATGNRSYTIGTYYKLFDQNVLSVSAPVTGNYTTYGYVLIHLPISEIANSQSHILDILYMTRVQRERFSDIMEYERVKNLYTLRNDMLAETKPNLRVLHPLPRVNEIDQDVDDNPKAYYFDQARNGLFARQAIICKALGIDIYKEARS